jgi:hypothetical protein
MLPSDWGLSLMRLKLALVSCAKPNIGSSRAFLFSGTWVAAVPISHRPVQKFRSLVPMVERIATWETPCHDAFSFLPFSVAQQPRF